MKDEESGAESREQAEKEKRVEKRALAGKLDTAEWAFFFIWVGVALLTGWGLGVGLAGVGVIILAGQVLRKLFKLKLECFWIVVGMLSVVGGLWEVYKPKLELVPVLLILVGLALFISAFRGKKARGKCC